MNIDLTFTIYKPVLSRAFRSTVIGRNRDRENPSKGRFTKNEVNRLLKSTWEHYRAAAPGIPKEKTLGARMNVRLAALTDAIFQSLLSYGISRSYAMELTADAAWKVYAKWAEIPIFLSKILPGKPSLEKFISWFLRFPFNPPGYQFQTWKENGAIHLDISRCPVASYLRSVGAADLCLNTWCKLDYPLAEKWEGKYSRHHTLAVGDEVCDMTWTPVQRS